MKTNITRDLDREYGYDLEIETSVSRDGICCHGYINGDCVVVKFGPMAETDVRVHLFRAVTWELDNGARENLAAPVVEETIMSYPDAKFNRQTAQNWDRVIEEDMQEEVMTSQPTYAELVAAREAAYIAQRDTENKLNEIKAALTATIAADPAYKNDQQRKAELVNRLQDYDTYVDQAQRAADQYRATLAALEVYQEQAKDARAKMRYETAQLELRAAELQLQAAQARHDAQEPTDEDPWGNVAKLPKGTAQHQGRDNWDFDAFNRVDETEKPKFALWREDEVTVNVAESCDGNADTPIGFVAVRNDDDGNFECYETMPGYAMRVYAKQADAYEAAKGLINDAEYERPSTLPVYVRFPF